MKKTKVPEPVTPVVLPWHLQPWAVMLTSSVLPMGVGLLVGLGTFIALASTTMDRIDVMISSFMMSNVMAILMFELWIKFLVKQRDDHQKRWES